MNDLSQVLKIGDLLITETGEYSDSCWYGPVRMLIETSKADLAEAFRREWRKEDFDSWRDDPDPSDFLAWLVKTNRAEDVSCTRHVGSYGRFEP
jgi:hypothetical protein